MFTDQGETVVIDGSTSDVEYVPLCGDCYLKYVKIKDKHVKKLTDLVNKVL